MLTRTNAAPSTAPTSCEMKYPTARSGDRAPDSVTPSVTAGLKWPPLKQNKKKSYVQLDICSFKSSSRQFDSFRNKQMKINISAKVFGLFCLHIDLYAYSLFLRRPWPTSLIRCTRIILDVRAPVPAKFVK